MITGMSANNQPTIQQVTPDRITSVAREFESLFTSMMLKAMRKTVGKNSLIPTGMGEKIYTGMLDDEYAKMIGLHASLGLSDLIEKELRRSEGKNVGMDQMKNPLWMLDQRLLQSGTAAVPASTSGITGLSERVQRWNGLIDKAAEMHGVDRNLIAAVIAQESGGNQHAVSRAGAKGLMQLMDTTARSLGVSSSFDAQQNVDGGVRYLRSLLDRYNGNIHLALASYNAGPGAVDKYQGIPPYRETQNYVRSVMALQSQFAALDENSTEEEQE